MMPLMALGSATPAERHWLHARIRAARQRRPQAILNRLPSSATSSGSASESLRLTPESRAHRTVAHYATGDQLPGTCRAMSTPSQGVRALARLPPPALQAVAKQDLALASLQTRNRLQHLSPKSSSRRLSPEPLAPSMSHDLRWTARHSPRPPRQLPRGKGRAPKSTASTRRARP